MKRSAIYITLCFLLVNFTGIAQAQTWSTWSNQEAKCKAEFPAKPEIERAVEEDGTTYTVSASDEAGGLFMVFATVHTNDLSLVDSKELAKISMEAFLSSMNGSAGESKEWKIGKQRGEETEIECEIAGQKTPGYYRVMIAGQIQYQLVYLSLTGEIDEDSSSKFLKSFKLLK